MILFPALRDPWRHKIVDGVAGIRPLPRLDRTHQPVSQRTGRIVSSTSSLEVRPSFACSSTMSILLLSVLLDGGVSVWGLHGASLSAIWKHELSYSDAARGNPGRVRRRGPLSLR